MHTGRGGSKRGDDRSVGRLLLWMLALAAAMLAVTLLAYGCQDHIPTWVQWDHARLEYGDYEARLQDGRLVFLDERGSEVSCTPEEWLIQSALCFDVDHDAQDELVLLSWRRGSFGSEHPFWHSEPNDAWTQHIFIIRFESGTVRPVWMSSALGKETAAVSNEGEQLLLTHTDGTTSLWEWGTWGLSLVEDSHDTSSANELSSTTSIVVTGDIIAHESLYEQAWNKTTQSFDFSPLFDPIRQYISSHDLAIACQETILVHDPSMRSGFPTFGTPESMGNALAEAGYDVVCVATNHAADKGDIGVADTIAFWERNRPDVTLLGLHDKQSAQSVSYVEINGIRIALANVTEHLNGHALTEDSPYAIYTFADLDVLATDIAKAHEEADFTLCIVHAGEEYSSSPSSAQRQAVQKLADAGADVIVCTHAHVVQSVEEVTSATGSTCTVFWCLGNLVSHQTDPRTIQGGAAHLELQRTDDGTTTLTDASLVPTVCHFDSRATSAYLLEDYTDELASRHTVDATTWYCTNSATT